MKNFIKRRWFPLVVAIFIVAAVAFIMALFGWRITYAPELANDWDAISAVATWIEVLVAITSAIASFLAVWFAIQVPRKIAKQQDKIALFEKRYRLYTLLLSCQTFALALKAAENMQDARKVFLLTYYSGNEDIKKWDDTGYISVCYLKVIQELSLSEFLFCPEISNGVLSIVKEMSCCLNDWFQLEDQSTFEKHKKDYIALYDEMRALTLKMKPYLNLSD